MTNYIKPNDFKPNGIKPSDHLPLYISRIFLVERTEVEAFDRIAGIEWNTVELYRICCMARMARFIVFVVISIRVVSIPFKNLACRPED